MDRDGLPLIMGDDPGVPERVRAMANRRFRKLQTEGDTACAIHALVGSDHSGVLRHADARGFLRRALGETAAQVRGRCLNFPVLDYLMNWAWKQVIKPQAEKDVGIRDGNLGMVDEEICLWEKIKENRDVRHACLCSVREDAAKWTAFEEKRTEVATALRPLCANEMKDIFLRPLLVHMGNLDDYERVDGDGHRKIDVVGADTALGQHYRRGIVEYFGMSNVSAFLTHVEITVNGMQGANAVAAIGAGVAEFTDLVREACSCAPVGNADDSVLEREPFPNFFDLVYPCYLDALCSHGYYLSDWELLLVCECAGYNAVIVRGVREFGRSAFMVHKYALPAGDFADIVFIAINAPLGSRAIRGHYERLECLTRALPPQPEPGASSDKQGASGRNGDASGAVDGMQVDAKGSALGRNQQVDQLPDVPDGADGRSGTSADAEQKMGEAEERRGSRDRKSSDGYFVFSVLGFLGPTWQGICWFPRVCRRGNVGGAQSS